MMDGRIKRMWRIPMYKRLANSTGKNRKAEQSRRGGKTLVDTNRLYPEGELFLPLQLNGSISLGCFQMIPWCNHPPRVYSLPTEHTFEIRVFPQNLRTKCIESSLLCMQGWRWKHPSCCASEPIRCVISMPWCVHCQTDNKSWSSVNAPCAATIHARGSILLGGWHTEGWERTITRFISTRG